MLNRAIAIFVFTSWFAAMLSAQALLTKTVPVDCWSPNFNECSMRSGRDGAPTTDWLLFDDFQRFKCNVPAAIPPGSTVYEIVARLYAGDMPFDGITPSVELNINGVRIGTIQSVTALTFHCNNEDRFGTYEFPSGFSPGGLPWFKTDGSPNELELVMFAGEGTVEAVDLEVKYEPPPPFEVLFDISDATPPEDRRVLLSNMHPGSGAVPAYPYPRVQGLLARDRVIPMNLRTRAGGVGRAGVAVTLKVIDPADVAPYAAGGPNVVQPVPGAHPGDNLGIRMPKLTGTGLIDNGNGTYSVASGANGYIQTVLELDASARAGDNYQVEATATYADGTIRTMKSGAITVWKRLFLEKRQMFRRGASLATDAPAGVPAVIVPDEPISAATGRAAEHFGRNDMVMLLHAPLYGQPKTGGSFYSGVYRIAARPTAFIAAAPAPGPGTVTTNGSNTIIGARTHFGRDVDPGDVITLAPPAGGPVQSFYVTAVPSNRELRVSGVPSFSAAALPYTLGDPNLVPGRGYLRLPLDRPLGEDYFREPLVDRASGVVALNDAVVQLPGGNVTATDYFDSSDELLTGGPEKQWQNVFPSAFTEYIVLSPQPPSPLAMPLPRASFPNGDPLAQWFVNKWFTLPTPGTLLPPTLTTGCGIAGCALLGYGYSVAPNHQLLLVGDSPLGARDAGQTYFTRLPVNQRSSVLDNGFVEQEVLSDRSALHLLDPAAIMKKIVVHELAHQWSVNAAQPGGHCQHVSYDSTAPYPAHVPAAPTPPGTLFCTMAFDRMLMMPAPWDPTLQISQTIRQYGNGHTALHVIPLGNHAYESEYLTIRMAADPWQP